MRIPTSRQRSSTNDMQTAMMPLIVVVFQLLIFIICVSTGDVKESLLSTDFRTGSVNATLKADDEKPLGEVWIQLKRVDGRTTALLEGREFRDFTELDATLRSLAAAATEIPIILDISGDVPLGDVIHVYDSCRSAKFRSINFAADANRSETKHD